MEQSVNIKSKWILIYNQSTVQMFCNSHLLDNIRKTTHLVNVHSTGGTSQSDVEGIIPKFGNFYLHEAGIMDILAYALVCDRHLISYNNNK